jgi:xylose dehydrogenase (NAD/NADP)
MKAVRWGMLSTARIGEIMLKASHRSSRARFVAIASRDRVRAEEMARTHGIEASFGSYEELVATDAIDAVYIPLPNALHAEWAIKALNAGKHVLCEKPLSRRPADVAAAFDAADRARKVLAEAFMYRYHPQTALARRLVEQGEIGRLSYLKGTLSITAESGDLLRNSAVLEGGALLDLGCYCVNAARLFVGEPERVYAEELRVAGGVDTHFVGTIRLPRDVIAQFDVGIALPRRDRLELVGSEGELVLRDPWLCRQRTVEVHRDGGVKRVAVDRQGRFGLHYDGLDVYRVELDAVSDAIGNGSELPFGRADAIEQARVLDALLRSAELNLPVELAHVDAARPEA